MWGVLINPIQEVMPGRTAWFGGKAVSQLFQLILVYSVCCSAQTWFWNSFKACYNGTEKTPIAARLSEAINEHVALITLSAARLLQNGNFTTDWWCSEAPDWKPTLGQGVDPALSSSPHKLGGRNTRDIPAPLKQGQCFTDDSDSQPRDRTLLMLQEKKKVRKCFLS